MSENNQIQETSSLIEETKVLLFNEILKSILKSKNAPFSEEVAHYLKEVISDDITNPSKIGIVKMKKEGNNYIVSLSGPFKSYVEVNGVESKFDDNGEINDLTVPVILKDGYPNDDYLAIVSFAYSETKPSGYTNNKTPQELINELESHWFLHTNNDKENPNVGVLEKFNVPIEKMNIDVFWNEEKNRFEIVNHMKDSIKFSLFNKEYVVSKKDVCKINIDWNTIKDLIERPFVSQHIGFKNKKDQNLGKEYIDEIINTKFISKESFLLGHGDENQFNVSIVYNDDTGNLEVKAVDNVFNPRLKNNLYIKDINPVFNIFNDTLDKQSDGVYQKNFALSEVKNLDLNFVLSNEFTIPYNKQITFTEIPTLTNVFKTLNNVKKEYVTDLPPGVPPVLKNNNELLFNFNTPKNVEIVLFKKGPSLPPGVPTPPGTPSQDIRMDVLPKGLKNANIVTFFKEKLVPAFYPLIFKLLESGIALKAADTYFDGVVPIDLDLTFNYRNNDFTDYPEILDNDFFSYINMTKNLKFIDIEGGLFKLKISDPNNVFGGKEFFVKAYQESKISKMTKQQDGTYLSEEIFISNRSRNVGAFYFAPTNLHFSLDLFMSAYGKPQ